MPDSSAVDDALIAHLRSDVGTGSLSELCPDGVWWDIAPNGSEKFVIVSLTFHEDEYDFGGVLAERSLYLVKAVMKDTKGTNALAAAARIHALLQDVVLTITGYNHMETRRQERIRYPEVDVNDPKTRWQHRGGRYALVVSPAAA